MRTNNKKYFTMCKLCYNPNIMKNNNYQPILQNKSHFINVIYLFIIILLCTLLSCCGFRLNIHNENKKIIISQTNKIILDCDTVMICDTLTNTITKKNLATIITNPTKNDDYITIRINNEQTSKDPQNFNSVGRISAYLLTYQVNLTIIKQDSIIMQNTFQSQSTMLYNDNIILASNFDEVRFWDRLHLDVNKQILNYLTHIN